MRAPVVFYNRCNEAAAQLKPGDFDWNAIFGGGVRWFHSGGIFAALSQTTAEVIIEGMQAAKAAGAVTSFDLNYRAKLWNISGGAAARGRSARPHREERRRAGRQRRGPAKGLGIPGPEVHAKSKLDPSAFFGMIDQVIEEASAREGRRDHAAGSALHQPPQLERGGVDQRQDLQGADRANSTCYDRVGGGDGFASGFFYGLLTGESPQEAVKLGWAHGALLTTFPGDTTMATVEQVRAFAKGGSARIQR